MAKLVRRRITTGRVKFQSRSVKKKTVSVRVRESESLLTLFAVLVISIISFSYVLQTNSIATKGYEVEKYEQRLRDLESEYKNMKVAEAELRSIRQLEQEKNELCSVSSSDIDFIDVSDTSVAMR